MGNSSNFVLFSFLPNCRFFGIFPLSKNYYRGYYSRGICLNTALKTYLIMSFLEIIIGVILFIILAVICIKIIAVAFILMFVAAVCWLLWWLITLMFAHIGWWVILVIVIFIILLKK